MWDETGDPQQLQHARDAGESLLASAQSSENEGVSWVIPPDVDQTDGQAGIIGYGHGAAGIADALIDLFDATQDEAYLQIAAAAGRWIIEFAQPVLEDGSGVAWPKVAGEGPAMCCWSFGAAGVGRFLLRCIERGIVPEAESLMRRAARAANSTRWLNPTQSQGLAGNIEFLLDIYQATQEQCYLQDAHVLARILEAFIIEHDGMTTVSSNTPKLFLPGFSLGYGGVATCLLRLLNTNAPHLISRQGFRYSSWTFRSLLS
jgi:lantibiotic modifying enzyme